MDDTALRALERRLDALEHSLVSGREIIAMKDRAAAAALQNIEAEQTQLWARLEKLQERWEASLSDQRRAFEASIKELKDTQWRLVTWAGALLATQVLSMLLKKYGLA
jgi:hypothetical protein